LPAFGISRSITNFGIGLPAEQMLVVFTYSSLRVWRAKLYYRREYQSI